jgi:hypothetical protein
MQDHTPQLPLLTIVSDDLPPIISITQKQVKDLTGKQFGRLAVLGFVGVNRFKQATWLCRCNCGNHSVVTRPSLVSGNTTSCGCFHNEMVGAMTRTHGLRKTTEYVIWAGIKTRCHNANTPNYKDYGARGITMCPRWLNSFENFLEDMGPRPTAKHTIERINNDLGYSPKNCRWATYIEQANNRRDNRILEFGGNRLTMSEWARKLDMPYSVLSSRLGKLGWSIEKALTTPTRSR